MKYDGLCLKLPLENLNTILCPDLHEAGAGAASEVCRLYPSSDDRYQKHLVKLSGSGEVRNIHLAEHAWVEKREFASLLRIASPLPGQIDRGLRTCHANVLRVLEHNCAVVGSVDQHIISAVRSREVACRQQQQLLRMVQKQVRELEIPLVNLPANSAPWNMQSLMSALGSANGSSCPSESVITSDLQPEISDYFGQTRSDAQRTKR